ncbi:hypothetical protein ACFIQF_01700 [Comamonas sp. J-3]|uniref:hypothetical protein n=1 Tax=Comamonas trifloxystrobinivorans TaxID=3350256 RepID=UPI003729ABAD
MNHCSFRAIAFSSLLSAALLTACGGGGGGDEAAEGGGSAPIGQADSEDCFNRGLYKPGSTVEYERKVGDVSIPFVWQVTPYAATSQTPALVQVSTVVQGAISNGGNLYYLDQDTLLEYGIQNGDMIGWSTPPFRRPFRMQPGEVSHQVVSTNYQTSTDPGPLDISTNIVHDRTYVGREVVETAMGRFETCKFEVRQKVTYHDNSIKPRLISRTEWYAATPPYRGFLLKNTFVVQPDGEAVTQDEKYEVSKITKFDVK